MQIVILSASLRWGLRFCFSDKILKGLATGQGDHILNDKAPSAFPLVLTFFFYQRYSGFTSKISSFHSYISLTYIPCLHFQKKILLHLLAVRDPCSFSPTSGAVTLSTCFC